MTWKPRWQIPLVALALALMAFMFASGYNPKLSLMGNIMSADFSWEVSCPPPPPAPKSNIDGTEPLDFSKYGDPYRPECHRSLPYRWVLAVLIGIAALGFILPQRAELVRTSLHRYSSAVSPPALN